MNDRVTLTIRDGVADVRLSRADKMNAIDGQMFDALVSVGEQLKHEASVRAVVLSGEGRGFCAGLDLESVQHMVSDGPSAIEALIGGDRTSLGANRAQQACMVWREVPSPVIAAIHGVAVGGGFQLALGCDLRFLAPDAGMSAMEIRWGLIPDMGGFALMRNLLREDVGRDLVWTGRMVEAQEALRIGLATRVCDDPRSHALAYAQDLAGRNPAAVRAGKRLLNLSYGGAAPSEVLAAESREQRLLIGSPNQIEAIAANMQRRPAEFRD